MGNIDKRTDDLLSAYGALQRKNAKLEAAFLKARDLLDAQDRELAELRKDKERLDWLAQVPANIRLQLWEDGNRAPERRWQMRWKRDYFKGFPDPRSAIDAAMEGEQ